MEPCVLGELPHVKIQFLPHSLGVLQLLAGSQQGVGGVDPNVVGGREVGEERSREVWRLAVSSQGRSENTLHYR